MTINRNPYLVGDRHYVDKDPDNKWYYVIDVTDEITKNNTTAVSATATADSRMTVIEGPTVQAGKFITIKVSGPTAPANQTDDDAFVRLHVTCANSEEFDKTLWFNQGNKAVVD